MFPCEIKEFAARPTLFIRFRSPVQDLPKHFGRVYASIGQYLAQMHEPHAGAAYAAYYNLDMQDMDIEAGFPVTYPLPAHGEVQAGMIPGGMFGICHYTGPYNEIGPAYELLTQYVAEHGYQPSGVAYEWYLNGPDVPPQYLETDIAVPIMPVGEVEKA